SQTAPLKHNMPMAPSDDVVVRNNPKPITSMDNNQPTITLAERRAVTAAAEAAAPEIKQLKSASASPILQSHGPPLPPNLGLDILNKRIALPPSRNPGAETGPLSNPIVLSSSAPSPAPIQIDRITPRNTSTLARTEEQ